MSPSILALVTLLFTPITGDVRSGYSIVYIEEIHCVTHIRDGRSRTVCRVFRRRVPGSRPKAPPLPAPPADPDPVPRNVAPVPEPPLPAPRPPTTSHSLIHTQMEQAVLTLLNQERLRRRLTVLRPDRLAIKAARLHSRDMCRRRFFSHVNPEGRQPWDRLRLVGARFSAAAENIAAGYRTARSVHHGWMTSPGHRQNRLSPRYTRAGVGIHRCNGRLYFTELFMR